MNINRRNLILTATAALAATGYSTAFAQSDWPARPVRVVSPYAAGGPSDISARIIAEALSRKFGQQFVIENKPGAGTRIANEYVARAIPDAYTLLYAATPFTTAEALYGKLSYNPREDFKPITLAVSGAVFLIVNASSAIKSVQDLVAYGKSKKEGLTFASPAAGSVPHLTAELFFKEAGVKGLNVHFRGDAPAYTELLAGRVDATLTSISTALPHVEAGKLRVIAVAAPKRSAIYPQSPTMAEQGMPNVVGAGWYGFMAPAKTPAAILDRLQAAIKETLADPVVKQKLIAAGLEPQGGSQAEFARFIEAETRKWTAVITKAHIKVE